MSARTTEHDCGTCDRFRARIALAQRSGNPTMADDGRRMLERHHQAVQDVVPAPWWPVEVVSI